MTSSLSGRQATFNDRVIARKRQNVARSAMRRGTMIEKQRSRFDAPRVIING